MAFSKGYTMDVGSINMDGLSKLYISIAIIWTLTLIPGAVILFRNRQLPYLRIRNIPLAVSSVATLHVYLILCFLVYTLQGNFPCQTEFWIMSIYLPLGIALYQAANTQLLHISALQKKFALYEDSDDEKKRGDRRGWRNSMEVVMAYSPTKRTLLFIAIGMIIQFACSMIIFLISRKFNAFGVVGHSVADSPAGRADCRRGWEWWPSIAWQLGWTWLYAPYLLWKVSGINDVHGWRIQTLICAIAGFPASPLWLAALYSQKMRDTVDLRWTPPLWFTPSIMLMQGFAIFGPCFQVYKNRRLESETRLIIAEWEHKKKYGTSLSSGSTKASKSKFSFRSSRSATSTTSSRNGEMYTMAYMEKSLQINSQPLLLFAALKDFSGENISFLKLISEWKDIWAPNSSPKPVFMRKPEPDTRDQDKLRRDQFALAVHLYSAFVSMEYSDFPINISSIQLRELQSLFDTAAQKLHGTSKHNSATPFADFAPLSPIGDLEAGINKDGASVTTTAVGSDTAEEISASPEKNHYTQVRAFKLSDMRQELPAGIRIPAEFGPDSFDKAERHVKELVLMNTWPKFVNAGYANNMSKMTMKDRLDTAVGGIRGALADRVHRRSRSVEA